MRRKRLKLVSAILLLGLAAISFAPVHINIALEEDDASRRFPRL